jgi:hypothetical protein
MKIENKVKDLQVTDAKTFLSWDFNTLKDQKRDVTKLKNSIAKSGWSFPVIVWNNPDTQKPYVIDGTGRKLAVLELLSEKHEIDEIPFVTVEADNLADAKAKALEVSSQYGEISRDSFLSFTEDMELDFSTFQIEGFDDITVATFDKDYSNAQKAALQDKYIIPPFSIFDSKQGYWQDRKRLWKTQLVDSGLGRSDTLLGEGLKQLAIMSKSGNLTGTSIFDPVLTEICYRWWGIDKGTILDPFAGGNTRGLVASILGYEYHGVDLSKDQVEANIRQANSINQKPNWYNGNSLDIKKLVPEKKYDLIFSCPPYYDLEIYTDDKEDLSNLDSYADFLDVYKKIIKESVDLLEDDRFAVFVVGDIRDKEGYYRGFVDDTIKAFKEAGMGFYNDIILANAIATAALRASQVFNSYKKVVKIHQNVLVFYKGDTSKIKDNYLFNIQESDIIQGEIEE